MVRNLRGQKFNRLTVIRLFKKRMYRNCRDAGWRCRCICGSFVNVLGSSLVNGRTKSCGCFHKEQQKKVREIDAPRNIIKSNYVSGATARGLSFKLTEAEFDKLIAGTCHYCGCKPVMLTRYRPESGFKYNGIDRLDSTKGYTTENCVSCCMACNWMKNKMPLEKFLQKVKEIAIYRRLL